MKTNNVINMIGIHQSLYYSTQYEYLLSYFNIAAINP
jgi:hypothetical protein